MEIFIFGYVTSSHCTYFNRIPARKRPKQKHSTSCSLVTRFTSRWLCRLGSIFTELSLVAAARASTSFTWQHAASRRQPKRCVTINFSGGLVEGELTVGMNLTCFCWSMLSAKPKLAIICGTGPQIKLRGGSAGTTLNSKGPSCRGRRPRAAICLRP